MPISARTNPVFLQSGVVRDREGNYELLDDASAEALDETREWMQLLTVCRRCARLPPEVRHPLSGAC